MAEGANLYDTAYLGNLPVTSPPFAGTLFKWISSLADDPLRILWLLQLRDDRNATAFLIHDGVNQRQSMLWSPSFWLSTPS